MRVRKTSRSSTITSKERSTAAAGTGDCKWQRNFRRFIRAKFCGKNFWFRSSLLLTRWRNVPRTRIERIAREEKPVTADTALRLGKFFKTGAAFWMNMQARFDLEVAEDVLAPQISKIPSYETI